MINTIGDTSSDQMAEAQPVAVAPDADEQLLEWPMKDDRRFLRAVYRVGDLDRTIEYVFFKLTLKFFGLSFFMAIYLFIFRFYTECFGMKLLRIRDVP